jgi:hypothetical protein
MVKYGIPIVIIFLVFFSRDIVSPEEKAGDLLSLQTQACIGCHTTYTPGIVEDWMKSKHL